MMFNKSELVDQSEENSKFTSWCLSVIDTLLKNRDNLDFSGHVGAVGLQGMGLPMTSLLAGQWKPGRECGSPGLAERRCKRITMVIAGSCPEDFKRSESMRKKWISVLLFGILLFLAAGCGGGSDDNDSAPRLSSDKMIEEFSLSNADDTYPGTIDQKARTITVHVPYQSDVTSMTATFVTTGISVSVNDVAQESGHTPNDFTVPVDYTVAAENDSKQVYKVTVIMAPSSAKDITSFAFGEVEGTIAGTEITITLPSGGNIAALVATFKTTGVSVSVEGVVQISGQTPNDFRNPVGYTVTAADGSARLYTVTVSERQNAARISVKMEPDNAGTSVPKDVFCALTPKIYGKQTVVPDDDRTEIVWEFLYNGVSSKRGKNTLGELKAQPAVFSRNPYFEVGSTVTYRATADGVVTDAISARIL